MQVSGFPGQKFDSYESVCQSHPARHHPRRIPLLLSNSRRLICLQGVDKGVRVDELLDLLDLQAPVRIGDNVCNGDSFVSRIHPDFGLGFAGELWGRYHVIHA